MFKVSKIDNNNVNVQYNSVDGFKDITMPYKKPVFTVSNDGEFKNLDGSIYYTADSDGAIYPYECFRPTIDYDRGIYFNTLLGLDKSVFDNVVFPNYVFYDIETGEDSLPVTKVTNNGNKYKTAPDTAIINSVAWIDKEDNEYCLIRGVDGSEMEILEQFITYLENNNITCLIGHNNYNFDDILLRDRLRYYRIDNNLFKKSTNQNNLDTLVLARLLNYIPKDKSIKLDRLAGMLDVTGKLDLQELNPITAYNESVKNNDFTKFKEYNIQDVRVTRDCFIKMDSENILTDLFNLTRCPFNKMDSVVHMLNYYTCNLLYDNKILIPTVENPKIGYPNSGGFNYIEKEKTLLKYDNIVCFDLVSYYPHLFMLIGADNNFEYSNFNTDTGELTPFNYKLPNGLLSEIASTLYDKRAGLKKEMKETKDQLKKQQLDYQQKTIKILINGMYGACDSNYNYILGSHKISTLITEIGRDVLKHLIEKYSVVYAKTDSIFIKVDNIQDTVYINHLLKTINNEVSHYLKETYNLNNFKSDGTNILRFEIDNIISKLIIKSKNEYIKILPSGETVYKGGTFTGDKNSLFEKDLTQFLIKDKFDITEVFKFCDNVIKNKSLDYFSKEIKLSSKTPNNKDVLGYKYMEESEIPYTWNFKYNGVRVESDKYDWILYPNGHTPELNVSPYYVYELAIKFCYNNHMINLKDKQQYFKDKNTVDGTVSINKYNKMKDNNINKPKPQKNKSLDIYKNNDNSIVNNNDSFTSKKLKELCKLIPDTKDYIMNDTIKLIPLNNERKTKFWKLKNYLEIDQDQRITQKTHIPQIPSGALINGNDNIGVYVNYNNLGCLDIDGAKGILNKSDNEKLVTYLKDLLVKTGVPFIIQKTQSNCYHLFYIGNNNFSFKGFKYPQDFFIKELAGTDLGTSTIEVLSDNVVPLAPTKTKTGEYKLLNQKYMWKQIFDNPVYNMFDNIKTILLDNGFDYIPQIETKTNIHKYNLKHDLVELTTKEISEVSKACIELMKISNKKHNKHYTSMAIGGYFSRYITYESAEKITYKIANECEDMFNDPVDKFITTVLCNYTNSIPNKTGFNTIVNNVTTDIETVQDKKQQEQLKKQNSKARVNLKIISNIIKKDIPHRNYIKLGFKNDKPYGFSNDKLNNVIRQTFKSKTEDDKYFIIQGEDTLLFCFDKIEIIDGFNAQTQELEDNKPTKYNFIIKSNRFNDTYKQYNDITLDDFINKIENLNLTVYGGNLKDYLRKIIHKFNTNGNIRKRLKPYNTGVFVYKDKILLNTPYINTDGDLDKGLETFEYLINNVFKNNEQYITIINLILLSMLNSVFKSLAIANGINKSIYICGAGETLKTFVVLCGIALFDKDTKLYESTGGDTNSAIVRRLSEDTLPLDIHDGKIDPSEDTFKQLIKSILYGFNCNIVSSGQYGDDVNIREAYRSIILTLNNNPYDFNIEKDDGEDRRINVSYFTKQYKVTPEQRKAIRKLLSINPEDKAHRIINNISSIGYEYLKFVQETIKPYDLTENKIEQITEGQGYGLISMFWNYINEITNYKYTNLCEMMDIPFSNFNDFIDNKKTEILSCLRKDFEKYTDSTDYKTESLINKWIEKSPLFITPEGKDYSDLVAIVKSEFKNIIKYVKSHKDTDYLFKTLFEDTGVNIKELNNFTVKGGENEDIIFYQNERKEFEGRKRVCYIKSEYVGKYLL